MSLFSLTSWGETPMPGEDGLKVQPETPLRERVRAKLEQLIVDGVLKPGEHLVEHDLAERLGVSRGPIREAFHQLHLAGWVDLRPRFGAFVHAPSQEEVRHFFDVRVFLEKESARLAATHAQPYDITGLREQIELAKRAIDDSDGEYLSKASEQFHHSIAEIGGNPVLTELVDLIGRRVRWYTKPMFLHEGELAWSQHGDLASAIGRNDTYAAVEIMEKHVERTRSAWLAYVATGDGAGPA